MSIDKKHIKFFYKIYDLPFEIESLFDYYCETFGVYFNIQQKIDNFNKIVEAATNCKKEVNDYYFSCINSLVCQIMSCSAYDQYKTYDRTGVGYQFNNTDKRELLQSLKNKSLYTPELCDKKLVSFDMTKASFTAMEYGWHIFRKIRGVEHMVTWEEFLPEDMKHFANIRHFRQVLFGKLYPGLCQQDIYHIMYLDLYCEITQFEEDHDQTINIVVFNNDEIIIEEQSDNDVKFKHDETLFKRTDFTLHKIDGITPSVYVKKTNDGVIFKCVPHHYFPIVYKRYFGLPLDERDLLFKFENKKCKFMEI